MNLPNRLTLMRIILVPLVVLSMLPVTSLGDIRWNVFVERYGMWIALILFVVASVTDHLDGAIARKRGQITNLGKFLDPIADKVLVLSVLIAFVSIGSVHAMVPILILFREFAVTGIRLLAVERGVVIAASMSGKAKTVSQIVAIILLMLHALAARHALSVAALLWPLSQGILFLSLVLTLWSGLIYFKESLYLFRDGAR